MAERRARLVRTPAQSLQLQWLGGQCQGCIGCGGRCALFPDALPVLGTLPATLAAREGDIVAVSIDDASLRRAAWQGYGFALLGLLLGAPAGHFAMVAVGQPSWANAGALVGLIAGVVSGARLARRGSAPMTDIVITPVSTPSLTCKDPECP